MGSEMCIRDSPKQENNDDVMHWFSVTHFCMQTSTQSPVRSPSSGISFGKAQRGPGGQLATFVLADRCILLLHFVIRWFGFLSGNALLSIVCSRNRPFLDNDAWLADFVWSATNCGHVETVSLLPVLPCLSILEERVS